MTPNSWAGAVVPISGISIQAITGETSGTSVDTTDYTGAACVVLDSLAGSSDTLTTNGAFASDTGWTKGTGWTIGSGKADCDGTQTAVSDLEQNQALTAGVSYTLTYTLSSVTAGSLTPRLGGTSGTTRTANGTYTEIIVCGAGTDPKLELRADADFVGKVDDVSVIAAKLIVKLQDSPDDSTWTDITGAVFNTVYGVASTQRIYFNVDACNRYVKALATPAGASATFTANLVFNFIKSTTP